MNIKSWSRKVVVMVLAMLSFGGSAAAVNYTADNVAIMRHIVCAPMTPMTLSAPHDSGTLLFSDSPEYAEDSGILYTDRISGDSRVYFYHVNQTTSPKKILVVAYNPTNQEQIIDVSGVYYAKPSQSYYQVGKELSLLYYEGHGTYQKVHVPAKGYAVVGDRLNRVVVRSDDLFSGIVDMHLPSEMNIATVIMPVAHDPIAFMKKQLYLASDSVQLRGTFPGKDRVLSTLVPYNTDDGIAYITIADGVKDRFLKGYDVLDKRISHDVGNYGVNYTLRIKTKGNGPIHYYLNPQGGQYAGVVGVQYEDKKNGDIQKIVEIPRHQLAIGDDDPYAMEYIDSIPAGTTVTFTLMPPGAANLPVRLLAVPDSALQQAGNAVQMEEAARIEREQRRQQQKDKEWKNQQQDKGASTVDDDFARIMSRLKGQQHTNK